MYVSYLYYDSSFLTIVKIDGFSYSMKLLHSCWFYSF